MGESYAMNCTKCNFAMDFFLVLDTYIKLICCKLIACDNQCFYMSVLLPNFDITLVNCYDDIIYLYK